MLESQLKRDHARSTLQCKYYQNTSFGYCDPLNCGNLAANNYEGSVIGNKQSF